jgi:NAD(P)-dependent dehydrogenase (short-subunit alcohol dehydrogenase family)
MQIEQGQTALVTGGGGGIGLATGEALARRGANVVLTDILEERLGAAVAGVAGPTLGVVMDIASEADWARTKAEAEARFGPVDILVNCAGTPPSLKQLLDTSLAEFEARITTHLIGTFLGLRTFGPAMRERRRGHIVNVASECGLVPMATLGDYSAAKYGIVGMTEILALELAEHGVGVSLVAPGLTRSNMTIGMGMEARHVGEAIVRGIEQDARYVLTHPSLRPGVVRRFDAILSAFGEPAEPGYIDPVTQWH